MSYQTNDELLGLAVHSLPNPQDAAQTGRTLTGRWKLIAIMVVCSLPLVAAYYAFYFVRPQGHAGMGDLISPVRPVGALSGLQLDGSSMALASLKGKWLLVAVGEGGCEAACQRQLFVQRQLRETLGKDKERVQRVWLIRDQSVVDPALRQAMGDAVVLRVDAQALGEWLALPATPVTDTLYVVDPLGNAMMRFPAQMDAAQASKARRDLERLLRATASWNGVPGKP
jgi:hypothetical protein